MYRSFLLLLIAASVAPAQTPVDTIRQLDARWARMYAEHDTVTAGQLYDDDLVFTASDGALKTKVREMADVRPSPGGTLNYFRTRDTQVRVFGTGAVATGRAEWSFTTNGQTNDVKRRYTMVYARGGPLGWRIVAVHMGRAP